MLVVCSVPSAVGSLLVYMCVYVCTYVRMCRGVGACTCYCMYHVLYCVFTVCMCICVYDSRFVQYCACMYVHICMYVLCCVCMYVCVRVYGHAQVVQSYLTSILCTVYVNLYQVMYDHRLLCCVCTQVLPVGGIKEKTLAVSDWRHTP